MRTLRWVTPCDAVDPITGEHECPYRDSSGYVNCDYWCAADEPDPDPDPDLADWEIEYEYFDGYRSSV